MFHSNAFKTGWFVALMLALPVASRADAPQDFSGSWVVAGNDQKAQDGSGSSPPAGSHHGGHGGGMGGGGGIGGMGGGGHGMGGGGGRRHSGGSSPDGATQGTGAGIATVVPRTTAQALTIRQSEVVLDVAADGGKRMVYRFDNRNNYGPEYGGTVSLTWSTPDMIIETHPDGGGSVEERYTLSEDGKRLTQHIHEERAGAGSGRDFTREFVRSGSAEAASAQTLP